MEGSKNRLTNMEYQIMTQFLATLLQPRTTQSRPSTRRFRARHASREQVSRGASIRPSRAQVFGRQSERRPKQALFERGSARVGGVLENAERALTGERRRERSETPDRASARRGISSC